MSKLFEWYGYQVKKGEYIFREGETADTLYMIHKGKVQISKEHGHLKEKVHTLEEGEFLGEMSLIDSKPRSADAIAMEDCQLIKMDKESFDKTIKENHQFAVSVIKILSERLRDTNETKTALALKDSSHQLLMGLMGEFIRIGKKDKAGEWILIKREPFEDDFLLNNSWDDQMFQEILNEILTHKNISIKKDKNGTEWVAYKVK